MGETERARKLLLALIFPVTADDMTEEQKTEFDLAAEEQAEYASAHSQEIKSESVGDVKISYSLPSGKSAPLTYYGQPVAPSAVVRLSECGLMRRYI